MVWSLALVCIGISLLPALSHGESLCARVKIEIRQELTLERQAFDARMKISNGLPDRALENITIAVGFTDEEGNPVPVSSDPNDTAARFFMRPDSEGLSGADDGTWRTGPVPPGHAPVLHWLIIPAPGASLGDPDGRLYYVGAELTYTLSGEEHATEVAPDYIFVKPLPQIVLDYFLTRNVYGDDAFTDAVEAPEPFTLGVRAKNTGAGVARSLRIDSAQPQIIENEQGLLIGFSIIGSRVNGEPAGETLLADLGDIAPGEAAVGRWLMSCTLSGTFTDFSATVSHADELGGELTSLIRHENIHTHFLIKDVRVDLAGRDAVTDFLAEDAGVLRVYESCCVDSPVADLSGASDMEPAGQANGSCRVTTAAEPGFIYIKLPDPFAGEKVLSRVVRSDGKIIKPCNAWLSRERKENAQEGWNYRFNLFDAETTGSYILTFEAPAAGDHPPVLQHIADKSGVEGVQLSFLVEADDPDGTVPVVAAENLPAGASLEAGEDGAAVFDWTPAEGQAGIYAIVFTASDEEHEVSRTVIFVIHSKDDSDGDGMDDDWEQRFFNDLERDGTGDFDGDGILDLQEFLAGCDPTLPDHAPSIPMILDPADGAQIKALLPTFTVANSTDPDGDAIFYDFELYEDASFRSMIARGTHIASGEPHTSWQPDGIPGGLAENRRYYWRVRASDETAFSLWRYGSFFVNTVNDPPAAPRISAPADGAESSDISPRLEITNSADPEGGALTYSFQLATDPDCTDVIDSVAGLAQEQESAGTAWTPDAPLAEGETFYWRAMASDAEGAWAATPVSSFTVNTTNQRPQPPQVEAPAKAATHPSEAVTLEIRSAPDPDGEPLYYIFEIDREKNFHSSCLQRSPEIAPDLDTASWHVTGLSDDARYYWRAKATDGRTESAWVYSNFFVNTQNNPPALPVVKNPGDGAWTPVRKPVLSVFNAEERDLEEVSYTFEICRRAECLNPIYQYESDTPAWASPPELQNNTLYYWRVLAADASGQSPGWTDPIPFFVRYTNHPPTITGIPATVIDQGELYSFTPIAEDTDPGDTITYSVTNKPSWAAFDPDTGALRGTPENEDVGTTEGIIITVTDAHGESASLDAFPITVLDVNDAPDAEADSYATARNIPLTVKAPGVLENDTDPDLKDELLSAHLMQDVLHGTLSLHEDGSFTYIPDKGFSGTDEFRYAASDAALDSEPAVARLEVRDRGSGPEISGISDITMKENTSVRGLSLTINNGSTENGPYTVTAVSANPDLIPKENILITGAGAERMISIASEEDRHGTAVISIVVEDRTGAGNAVGVTVTVTSEFNLPAVLLLLLN
jgi:hypothetical protein